MKIEHIAIWVEDLEAMKAFYTRFFHMHCSDKYVNELKGFSSYFLSFEAGARIELMHRTDIVNSQNTRDYSLGITHFAISTGSREAVDQLTAYIRENGYQVAGEPRVTGDGFYESVILDPEGNRVEITE